VSLRDGAAHLFVASLAAPVLDDADVHHVLRVLRVRPGEPVTVTDGQGAWAPATVSRDGAVTLTGETMHAPQPRWRIGVAFAPVKAGKPEVIVQKLTELGVDDVVPLVATVRSVARWDASRAGRQHARLVAVAREAAMQSRRTRLPVVHEPMTLDAVGAVGGVGGSLAYAEPGGDEVGEAHRLVVVGPEGGFDPGEIPPGAPRVSLGEGILRSETAAIVAGALMSRARRCAP